MWVQLLTTRTIMLRGVPETYHAGDWIDIGKSMAVKWLEDGSARIPEREAAKLIRGAGLCLYDCPIGTPIGFDYDLAVSYGEPALSRPYNLLRNPAVPLDARHLPLGFHLLERWEMAVPLFAYDTLLSNWGTEADREATAGTIPDLRLVFYEPGVIFARRCPASLEVIDRWRAERQNGNDHHAFMRAVYAVQPRICALPTTWIGKAIE